MKNKLSAVVITYNEVIHVDAFIENLSFADELIVVDNYSTDGTLEKLQSNKNVKVYQHKFESFSKQKNAALSKASNDWVLFTDADERISEDFKKDAITKINEPNNIVAYYSLFRYYFGNKPIRFSGFQTAKSFRLFRKSKCHYDESLPVHEDLIVKGKTGMLKHRIDHYSFRDYEHYKQKMTTYAQLKAEHLHVKGKTVNTITKYLKIAYRFFNHYIMRLGILDGKVGFQISILNAYEVKKRYEELTRLNSLSPKK